MDCFLASPRCRAGSIPILFAVAAAVLCGLPGPAAATEPRVSIVSIDALQVQPDGATVDLTLKIENPQGVALPLQALHFQCYFGTAAVAQGTSLVPVTLPANGSARVPVRLDIDGATLVALSAAVSSGDALAYRIEGTAEVGLTGIPLPFVHTGTILLGGAPQAAPRR
jgi:LEA14-like dessication related protein